MPWRTYREVLQDQLAQEMGNYAALVEPGEDTTPPPEVPEPIQTLTAPRMETRAPTWLAAPAARQQTAWMRMAAAPTVRDPQKAIAEAQPGTTPAVGPDYEWWEKPKGVAEAIQSGVGEVVSKVPLLPKVLEFLSPAFNWVHENLEKPWSAIITSPWSPSISWKSGESWLEHEKREYEAWNAPTYVKGAAEFSMPLWWLPYFGWAAKGARALGVGEKAMRALSTVGKTVTLELPAKKLMGELVFKRDFYKTAALWAEGKPVLHRVFKAIGGEAAFLNTESKAPMDVARKEVMLREISRNMGDQQAKSLMPRLEQFGVSQKVLDIADDGLLRTAQPKTLGASRHLTDVLENPEGYTFTTKAAQKYVDEFTGLKKSLNEMLEKEGLKPSTKVHRFVDGIVDEDGVFHKSTHGSDVSLERVYETMEEGVLAHLQKGQKIVYGVNPNEIMNYEIRRAFNRVAQKRFEDGLKDMGATWVERFGAMFPESVEEITRLATRQSAARDALQAVKRVTSFRGSSIPGATMSKIRANLPEVAAQLDRIYTLRGSTVDKVLNAMAREMRKETGLSAKDLKMRVTTIREIRKTWVEAGEILMMDLDDAARSIAKSQGVASKAVEAAHKALYKEQSGAFKEFLKANKEVLEGIIQETKGGLAPLIAERNHFRQQYAGREFVPRLPGEVPLMRVPALERHPVFKGKFFDAKVAQFLQNQLKDEGSKWMKQAGAVGATSRLLVAALDLSAPFIQGLSVFGRNPVAWGKSVLRQFEFAVKPENFTKYMAKPEIQAVHQEMIRYGSQIGSFEFFESLGALGKAAGRIPKVGGAAERVIQETFGRAEAAFVGFGQVARDNMWQALRRPGMTEIQLRDLSRSIDRMTGVMSTGNLGIGKTQRDFESAFLFFAPRYTRASLAFAADVLKGGMTGAEARKAVGMMMASGASFYIGASKVLGQQPNLDPTSGRFMTLKIGDSHVGVGGMMYSLMRLGANVAVTAADPDKRDKLSPLNLSRVDNPFYRFLYSKSAPLTGLAVGLAIEQKNFFGEPFENAGDWAKFLAEKVTPISMQRLVGLEKASPSFPIFASEFMGGRTFPKGTWELRDEARDRESLEKFGVSYDDADLLQRKRVDNSDVILAFQDELDRGTTQRGDAISVAFLQRQRELDEARFMHKQQAENLSMFYETGQISGYDFRMMLHDADLGYGATYEHINGLERYAGVLEKLKEPRDVDRKVRWELAFDELMGGLTDGRFENEIGEFDFDALEAFKDGLRQKYGDADFEKAEEARQEKYVEYPRLFHQLQLAKEVLRPYWDIEDEVIAMRGQPKTQWQKNRIDALVSKIRKRLLQSDREMAKWHALFYKRPPEF